MFWKITFQLTLKICGLNSDVNIRFYLAICLAIYVYVYFRFGDTSSQSLKIWDFVRYVTVKMCDLNSDLNDLFLLS